MTDEQTLEFRRVVRTKVASIKCTRANGEVYSLVGIILHSDEYSVFVVVRRPLQFADATYEVTLPDGSMKIISSSDFSTPDNPGCFAGFHVRSTPEFLYDYDLIDMVEVGDNVIQFQNVHLCNFYRGNWNFTKGHVVSVGERSFAHCCGSTPNTGNSAPVFNDQGLLVGISTPCMLQGPTTSSLSTYTTQELLKFKNGYADLYGLKFAISLDGRYGEDDSEEGEA